MSKSKSVWESRFYVLKHRLKSYKEIASNKIAQQAIDAKGKELNTTLYWEHIGRYKAIENLIEEAEYIETQMYF